MTWAKNIDLDHLSMVQWLVVQEPYSIEGSPARRSGSFFDQPYDFDQGAVKPHENGWPRAVQDALFFLLLAPWEDWVPYPQWNAFGFAIPWVHTAQSDIFISPAAPPTPDKLSIYPNIYHDSEGNEHEADAPEQIYLHSNLMGGISLPPIIFSSAKVLNVDQRQPLSIIQSATHRRA